MSRILPSLTPSQFYTQLKGQVKMYNYQASLLPPYRCLQGVYLVRLLEWILFLSPTACKKVSYQPVDDLGLSVYFQWHTQGCGAVSASASQYLCLSLQVNHTFVLLKRVFALIVCFSTSYQPPTVLSERCARDPAYTPVSCKWRVRLYPSFL